MIFLHEVFSRPLTALGRKGDVLIAISTSGKSKNILKVLKAKEMKIFSICFGIMGVMPKTL